MGEPGHAGLSAARGSPHADPSYGLAVARFRLNRLVCLTVLVGLALPYARAADRPSGPRARSLLTVEAPFRGLGVFCHLLA